MATENKGVIYYKLDPDYHYEGDCTKNCGLNGGEIDGNFHFLRGYDISEMGLSKDREELVLTRFNGDKLSVNLKENFSGYDFEYDKSAGVLKITMPYGDTMDLEGFLTERIFHVYGDFTVDGDGTRYNPIRVSSIAKTGTYRPAKTMLDLADENSGEELPTKNIALNERYVTREKVSKYGLLYPLTGVDAIQKRLQEIGSEWRIPTKADWDQLFNIIEDCPEDKNHESNLTNTSFGKNAGAYLKSVEQWKPYYRKLEDGEIVLNGERFTLDGNGNYIPNENGEYLKVINSEDNFGFAVYPVGFGGSRSKSSIGGFGECAAYWSSTEEDRNRDMYVKAFSYDERTIEQNTCGRDCYLSIRLVKDYTGENFYDTEIIDGNAVTTKHFVMDNDADKLKYDTTLIWTCENIGFSNPQYGGVVSPEWHDAEGTLFETRYYINDWDGEKWVKNEIQEGESIVLFEEEGVEMHEWRIVNGKLVDTLEIIMNEVANDFKEVHEKIENLEQTLADETNERIAADDALKTELSQKITANAQNIDKLNGVIAVEGSVRNMIFESVVGDVINNISPEDAKNQTLIKKINIEGLPYFYASNNTADMMYETRVLSEIITELIASNEALKAENEELKLNNVVLVTNIEALVARLDAVEEEMKNMIVEIDMEAIKTEVVPVAVAQAKSEIISSNVFKGTYEEIGVDVVEGESVTYKFADDAVFMADYNELFDEE